LQAPTLACYKVLGAKYDVLNFGALAMKKASELRFGFIDAERYLRNPDDPLSESYARKLVTA
jgi:hypothetical protein